MFFNLIEFTHFKNTVCLVDVLLANFLVISQLECLPILHFSFSNLMISSGCLDRFKNGSNRMAFHLFSSLTDWMINDFCYYVIEIQEL